MLPINHKTILTLSLGLHLLSCNPYRTAFVKIQEDMIPARHTISSVGIGIFEFTGSTSSNLEKQHTFPNALAFCLREHGLKVHEPKEMMELLQRSDLPVDKLLSTDQLLQFSGRFPGEVFLQGRILETKTSALVQERYQIMITSMIHEMKTGKKVAEIVLFGKDLDYISGLESATMAKLICENIQEIIPK